MIATTIAGSPPKPAWLAEPEKLWAPWRLEGDALVEGQQDPGPGNHPSRMTPGRDQLDQLRAITRAQADRELLRTRHDLNSSQPSIDGKSGPHIPIRLEATRH